MKYKFKIKGLDCANCAAELEREIKKIDGIDDASISFMSEKLIIECEESVKENVLEEMKKVIKREEPDVTIEEK
jgi:copper chaperone CopZ